MERIFSFVYLLGGAGTFIFLTFFDGYPYTWWNWVIALGSNAFLSGMWPIYWSVLHWI